jgi:hypothetical protein
MTVLDEDEIPVVYCKESRDKKQWTFRCPYCKATHYHSPAPGHRMAHCYDFGPRGQRLPLSPYRKTGYILALAPKAPASRP